MCPDIFSFVIFSSLQFDSDEEEEEECASAKLPALSAPYTFKHKGGLLDDAGGKDGRDSKGYRRKMFSASSCAEDSLKRGNCKWSEDEVERLIKGVSM